MKKIAYLAMDVHARSCTLGHMDEDGTPELLIEIRCQNLSNYQNKNILIHKILKKREEHGT